MVGHASSTTGIVHFYMTLTDPRSRSRGFWTSENYQSRACWRRWPQSPCGAFWFFVVLLKLLNSRCISAFTLIIEYYEGWCRGSLFKWVSGSMTYVWSALSTTKGHAQKRVNFGFFRHTNFKKIHQETQKVQLKDRNRQISGAPLGIHISASHLRFDPTT